MVNDELKRSITQTAEKIKEDKTRLLNIINAINSGITDDKVNEKLIDNIVKFDYDNENVSDAMEYISIVLSNMRTQKFSDKKGAIDELLRILEYNLEVLSNLEHAIILLNKVNQISVDDDKIVQNNQNTNNSPIDNVVEDTLLKDPSKGWLDYLAPKGKVDSTLMWAMVLIITMFILYKIDSDALKEANKVTNVVTGITSVISNSKEDKEE